MAAIGFTLQIYFDFSGYTDMALGIARLIGIRLPPNFNSPLKATSIIDFWLRWHMTLTRFLTAYIYNPLALVLTRRRLSKGRAAVGGRPATLGSFVELLVFPTLITMLVSGIWHGAGYLFILWGFVHGIYLTVNHGWRLFAARRWPNSTAYQRVMAPVGFILTFLCVVTSMVIFRATNGHAAANVLEGMLGLNGFALPEWMYDHLRPLAPILTILDVTRGLASDFAFNKMAKWIVVLATVAFLCPNTLQLLARYEPAHGWKPTQPDRAVAPVSWKPSLAWAVILSIIGTLGIVNVGGLSEFLYWQF
jgi:D-alanyl-lipoteichoic acid acyltransferase DltB (MBOAT superfamily)